VSARQREKATPYLTWAMQNAASSPFFRFPLQSTGGT